MAATLTLSLRTTEFWLRTYRARWRGDVFSGFLAPLLYLGALGFGLGALVDSSGSTVGGGGGAGGAVLDGVRYAAFVAPGVLASNAMSNAIGDATWPIMGAVKWQRQFHAMLAAPLDVVHVYLGTLGFVLLRQLGICAVFAGVGSLLGAFTSPWVVVAALVAAFGGVAHAAPVMAFSAHQENDGAFVLLYRLAVVPMFLFAGTFFPVSQLPALLQPVAWVTPLWHVTQACRSLVLDGAPSGTALAVLVGHLAYVALWLVAGVLLGVRAFRRRLVL